MSETIRDKRRITPIYMGSTNGMKECCLMCQDHPHIHGEHKAITSSARLPVGSPPYTWGARARLTPSLSCFRITPIYMGSTSFSSYMDSIFRDHPHIHGEHFSVTDILVAWYRDHPHIHGEHGFQFKPTDDYQGSPPYTWGAQPDVVEDTGGFGITPIYMGST